MGSKLKDLKRNYAHSLRQWTLIIKKKLEHFFQVIIKIRITSVANVLELRGFGDHTCQEKKHTIKLYVYKGKLPPHQTDSDIKKGTLEYEQCSLYIYWHESHSNFFH